MWKSPNRIFDDFAWLFLFPIPLSLWLISKSTDDLEIIWGFQVTSIYTLGAYVEAVPKNSKQSPQCNFFHGNLSIWNLSIDVEPLAKEKIFEACKGGGGQKLVRGTNFFCRWPLTFTTTHQKCCLNIHHYCNIYVPILGSQAATFTIHRFSLSCGNKFNA